MLFNSLEYAIFLPIVFLVYWLVFEKNVKWQNIFILIVSYVFYGWVQWKLLSLLFIATVIDYFVALGMSGHTSNKRRKILIIASIAANLMLLGFFKYYNFFIENVIAALSLIGIKANFYTLSIMLPAGISFYTFQTMSYTLDVYKRKISPTKDFITFAAYVGFFPPLVSGPIGRAGELLPQFFKKRQFDYHKAADGLRQILWGCFKKIVIADNCSKVTDLVYNNYHNYSGPELILAGLLFTIQIYGDFSGYSDIAIGSARLLGFDLTQNFAAPYFSRSIAEFWRRWHISLYSWFRDYVYIPLGGSKQGKWKTIRNVFIIFLLSGLWHGAAWNFILWGLLNGVYFLPVLLTGHPVKHEETVTRNSNLPSISELLQMGVTFALVSFSMMVFRARNVRETVYFVTHSLSGLRDRVAYKQTLQLMRGMGYGFILLMIAFFIVEWLGRRDQYAIEQLTIKLNPVIKYAIYYSIALLIILWGNFAGNKFIYFQF